MVILQTIELVVKSRIDDISYPKIKSVIQLASEEMTKSKVGQLTCTTVLKFGVSQINTSY